MYRFKESLSCFRFGVKNICMYCQSENVVKSGKTSNNKQRYFCKKCSKRFIRTYEYYAYHFQTNHLIVQFTKEGLGIRSIARILKISTTTLLKRILLIAEKIPVPLIFKMKNYEVDEMRTFVKKKSKLVWIVYALERCTKTVVSFSVGARTNKTLNVVLKTLQLSEAKRVYTDKLPAYKFLLPNSIHRTNFRGTNHIERMNLNLRTHLKRLNRRTICFSKSIVLLSACLKIYFWG